MIVAGFPRVGTVSLKEALVRIGYGPCLNNAEIIARPGAEEPWLAAARGEPVDWDTALAGYEAAVDWPAAAFWRELAGHFPGARVVLATRDPESWWRSAFAAYGDELRLLDDPRLRGVAEMTRLVGAYARRSLTSAGTGTEAAWPPPDAASAARIMRSYEAAVTEHVPADRLLRFRVTDGWAPLCAFLGVPVPDTPFPHLNSGAAYREQFAEALRRRAGAEGDDR